MDEALIRRITKEVQAALIRDGRAPAALQIGKRILDDDLRVGKVFITADILLKRLAGSNGGSLELAGNEYLTPAAADLAERRHLNITRAAHSPAPPAKPALSPFHLPDIPISAARKASSHAPAGLIVDAPCELLDSVIRALAHDGIQFTDLMIGKCWMGNLNNLCRHIIDAKVSLGVAMVPDGNDAVIMANKFRGIYALLGTSPETVSASVRRIGANLLVLGYRERTYHQLRTMTRSFISDRMVCGTATNVIRQLKRLEDR